jgi:hypothetical protein
MGETLGQRFLGILTGNHIDGFLLVLKGLDHFGLIALTIVQKRADDLVPGRTDSQAVGGFVAYAVKLFLIYL